MDIYAELETSGLKAIRQGSLLPDEPYPDEFWTVWEPMADEVFYDNEPVYTTRAFSVCFYSNNPATARAKVQAMRNHLRGKGYAVTPPEDTPSDEATHIGYAFDAIINEQGENRYEQDV